ncbi:MAG: hypothetical protein ACRDMX_12790 [Solirubrobacteraceae bacterium]
MRRFTILVGGLLGAALVALPGVAVAGSGPPSRAALARFECRRAVDPGARAIAVQAAMRPVAGTRRLAVSFRLLERPPGASSSIDVQGGTLDTWITPRDRTLGQRANDVWRVSKPVYDLVAPARYRFRVAFRWTGVDGKVLGTSVRYSATCIQRELRPDLLVRSITVAPIAGRPDRDLYTAAIADRGATGTGPFQVEFVPGAAAGAPAPTIRTVRFLHAHRQRVMRFVGPVCDPTAPPSISVDPAGVTDDYNRANNELVATCPAAIGAS